ncbi:MAG: hypothetical protein KDA75_23010, partial [Planctomycetaceae bacterium]|nr:hypothetical protein [Planctomycetaceae bacterium]
MLHALPGQRDEIRGVAEQLGVQTLLAISGILDHAASRLRVSTQVRTLAEMAIVRICRLGDLDELAALIEAVKAGATPMPAVKKNGVTNAPPPSQGGAGGGSAAVSPTSIATPASDAATAAPVAPPSESRPTAAVTDPAATVSQPDEPVAKPAEEEPAQESTTAPPLDAATAKDLWRRSLAALDSLLGDHAAAAEQITVDAHG